MRLTIGRNHANNHLQVSIDGKPFADCKPAVTLSPTASSAHFALDIDKDHGTMTITNLKPANFTWVNGVPVSSCPVTTDMRLALGSDQAPFDWKWLDGILAKALPIDIRQLEKVWKRYKKDLDAIQFSQTMVNVLRGAIPILTIGGVAFGFVSGSRSHGETPTYMVVIYITAAVLMIALFIKSFIDAKRVSKKREKLQNQLIHDYVCPKCGYFFGYQSYDVLRHNLGGCPGCRSSLIK